MNGINRMHITGTKTATPPWCRNSSAARMGRSNFTMDSEARLAPVAFFPVPPAVFMVPAAIDPDRVGPRRLDPPSRNPDIRATVPAMVSGAPVPAVMGPRRTVLHPHRGRPNLYIDVLRESRRDHRETYQCCGCNEKQFLHGRGIPFSRKFVSVAARVLLLPLTRWNPRASAGLRTKSSHKRLCSWFVGDK